MTMPLQGRAVLIAGPTASGKSRLALEIARLETERARAAEGVTLDLVGSVGANRLAGAGCGQAEAG